MKKMMILAFICAVMNINAADKPKKEKTSKETIAELKAQLEAFEQVQLYEKYEREISRYKPSKKLKSRILLLTIKTKSYDFPKSQKRTNTVSKIIKMYQSFIDNNVPRARQKVIAKSLRSQLEKENIMSDKEMMTFMNNTHSYLKNRTALSKLNPKFPYLLQGASYAHSKILASSSSAGRTLAIKVMAGGGSDLYANLVYQKANKGHWTLTAKEKLLLSAMEKGKTEKEAMNIASKKEAVSQRCENYTGKTITCDGKLFILAEDAKTVSVSDDDELLRGLSSSK